MLSQHLRSNVVGYLALFIALSAGAYAAGLPKNSVKSKQIKDGQVKAADLAADSVDSSKVTNGSLTNADFGGTLPAGAQGPQGPQGPAGSPDTGAQILDKLAPVDGSGSGLDSDLLDGLSSNAFIASGSAAGGDLGGTYPNPQIGGNAVGAAEVADGTIGPDELATVPGVRAQNPRAACNDSSGLSVANDTDVAVPFQFSDNGFPPEFDDGGLHNGGSNCTRLTAPRPGVYTVSAGVLWAASAAGKRTISIRQGGSTLLAQDEYDAAATGATLQNVSTIVRLSAGGYVETVVRQTSGGSLLIEPNDSRSFFAMAWLGP